MMVSVVRRPTKRSFLQGTAPEASQHKLKGPARLVGTMGKVAVVARGDAEHPHKVKNPAQHQAPQVWGGEEHGEAGQVQAKERKVFQPRGQVSQTRALSLPCRDTREDSVHRSRSDECFLSPGRRG